MLLSSEFMNAAWLNYTYPIVTVKKKYVDRVNACLLNQVSVVYNCPGSFRVVGEYPPLF